MRDGVPVARRAEYGFDAGFLMPAAAVVCVALIVVAAVIGSRVLLIEGVVALLIVGLGLHTSRRGKFQVWDELLDGLRLEGDEQVLDMGCGRGAVLIAAAKRLPKGRGIGGTS